MNGREKVTKAFNRATERQITSKVTPMPADTIKDKIIGAGWLLSQMDVAGGNRAYKYVSGRAVTVGLESMKFEAPVHIGDDVTIYTEVVKQGRSSVSIKVEAWAEQRQGGQLRKVTEGVFTFVHIDENGKSTPIDPNAPPSPPSPPKPRASQTDSLTHEPVMEPGQELSLRTVPMPRDKNQNGDIFGGWVLAQMDLAANLRARKEVGGTTVSVAINAMTFHRPVSELNEVSFYTAVEKIGNTSITIKVEAWALREDLTKYEKVTEGSFTYVAVDKDRKPIPVRPPNP